MKLSRRATVSAGVAIVLTVLAGSVFALANISLSLGRVASYNFEAFGPGYPVPGTVQIQTFTMKPGDTVPWHFHKATSYVILARGSLTERHVTGPNTCDSVEVTAGDAFVEPAGLVHTVSNTGRTSATILWATIFPESDGVVRFSPEFSTGGVYPPLTDPVCN